MTVQPPRRSWFFWFAIAAGVCVLASLAAEVSLVLRYRGPTFDPGFRAGGRPLRIVQIDAQSPAAEVLRAGDRLVSVNGDRRVQKTGVRLKLRFERPGQPYRIAVDRAGSVLEFTIAPQRRPSDVSILDVMVYTVVALAFWSMGMIMGLLKPDEALTRLGCVAGLTIPLQMLGYAIGAILPAVLGPERIFLALSLWMFSPLHFAIGYDFLYRFPAGEKPGGFWRWLRWALYAYTVPEWILERGSRLANAISYDSAIRWQNWLPGPLAAWSGAVQTQDILLTLIGLAGVAVTIRNYRAERDTDRRRRIKWVIYAIVAGVAPGAVLNTLLAQRQAASLSIALLLYISNVTVVVIPVTLAYVVMKHRVMGIEVVVRRSLQYLLARNFLRVLLVLPLVDIGWTIAANPTLSVRDMLLRHGPAFYCFLAVTAVLLRYRREAGLWLDRRFFREAYSQEKILRELLEQVQQADRVAAIAPLVSSHIEAALHPAAVRIFYRREADRELTIGYSSTGSEESVRIANDRPLVRALERRTQSVPVSEEISGLPAEELEWLRRLAANLVVPIPAGGRLAGLLVLGAKKSEEPYTRTDRQFLEAIARQIGLVCENLWLKERVEREQKVRTDVLAHLHSRQVSLLHECPVCGACFDADGRCPEDDAELSLTLPVERTLEGKYRLDRLLGKGGMGAVYAATDLRLSRAVAVKVMVGSSFGNASALRRFEREAQATARLNHPHIAAIHDFGTVAGSGAFLVMELLRGCTLRQELRLRGRLDSALAIARFEQIFSGVEAAHGSGIVHRDLKPENVFVAQAGADKRVKILDFGLAKLRSDGQDSTFTADGAVLGTLGYMSPEQFAGSQIDQRTDIFALGVMLVEALTGKRPFTGKTHSEMVRSIFYDTWSLAGEGEAVRALDAALQRSLAKDPAERFADVQAMRLAILPALQACPPLPGTESSGDAPTMTMME